MSGDDLRVTAAHLVEGVDSAEALEGQVLPG